MSSYALFDSIATSNQKLAVILGQLQRKAIVQQIPLSQLSDLQNEMSYLTQRIKSDLDHLNDYPETSIGDLKLKKRKLRDEFLENIVKYQKLLLDVKGDMKLQGKEKSQSFDVHNIPSESYDDTIQNSHPLNQEATLQDKMHLEELQQRQNAFEKLEGDIVELNEIFQTISASVLDQGTIIDGVEENIEQAVYHTEKANTELRSAVVHKSGAMRKKIYIVIIIVAAILIFILILKFLFG